MQVPYIRITNVSIHAPREGCDYTIVSRNLTNIVVSIHAPREGCDAIPRLRLLDLRVSIHAPREGCD